LYFTERKATGIVMLNIQFITLSLTSHLDPDLPKCLFFLRFPTKFVCVFLISPVRFSRPFCPTVLQFTTHHQYQFPQYVSLVPSVQLSFSSPPTGSTIHAAPHCANLFIPLYSLHSVTVCSPAEHKHKHKYKQTQTQIQTQTHTIENI
jgi:hypothetical protein